MSRKTPNHLRTYIAVVVAVVVATIARMMLTPLLGERVPFVTFFVAVVFAAWYGGLRPSIVATLLSALAAAIWFLPPVGIAISGTAGWTGLIAFLFVGFASAYLGELMHVARARAEASSLEANRQRELLRITLASIGDAVISTDADGRVTFLNPVAASLTGWTTANAVGVPLIDVFQIVNETTRKPVENPALRAIREGTIVGLANHTILIAKDGTEWPIDDSAAPIRNEAGDVVGSVLVFRDITERKQAERELLERERALRLGAEIGSALTVKSENLPEMLQACTDSIVRNLDAAFARIWTLNEVENVLELRASSGLYTHLDGGHARIPVGQFKIGRIAEDNQPHLTNAVIGDDRVPEQEWARREGMVAFAGYPLEVEGRVVGVVAMFAKRELKQTALDGLSSVGTEIALAIQSHDASSAEQRQRKLLQVTLASIGDAVISTDASGRVTFLNPVAASLTGWTTANAVGVPLIDVFQIVNETTRKPVENPALRAIREGTIVGLANHTILIAKDGTEWPIDDSAAPIRNEAGDVVGSILVFRDITEHKKTARAIEESESRKKAMLDTALDGIITIDHEGLVVEFNTAAVEMFGIARDSIIGQEMAEFLIPPEMREQHRAGIAHYLETGEGPVLDQRLELTALHSNGRTFPVEVSITKINEDDPPLFTGYVRNITQRKQHEEEVREARSRLESTLVAAEIGTWEYDITRNLVRADKNLSQMFGMPPDDGEGRPMEEYTNAIHPEDREEVKASIAGAIEAEDDFEAEYRIVDADGDLRWVIARGRVERDSLGSAIRLPGVIVDITEQKEIENQLRDSEEHRQTALDSAELGTWNIDTATNILTTDERFQILFTGVPGGFSFEEAFEYIHPDDRQRIRDAVAASTRIDDPVPYAQEYRVIHSPESEPRWVLAKGRANFKGTGSSRKLVSFDGTIADVTGRKQMEEALRQLAADLSEADRRKTEFLATLGHELRNPLAPIRTGLEVMKLCKDDPETIENIRLTMERQTQQMVRLIDDLLDVSRITRGKLELRITTVELADLIQSAVEATKPFLDEEEHNLSVSIPSESILLDADPTRIAQVFSNLLNNASKFTPKGGEIELTVVREKNEVVVSVKDNGLGVPRELQESIFDMFTQIDRPAENAYSGLGIGLTLVKRLVTMHKGTIEVRSEGEDRGSEFLVRLPVLQETPDAKSAQEATLEQAKKLRILVVDDNQAAATMLKMVVEMLGNDVRSAHDGEQAVAAAAEFRPEVVLMDLGMPVMNGYEAARRIREHEWGKTMLLVALTGWGQEEDRQRTQEAGFDHHLVKPAEPDDLKKLFASVKSDTN